MASSEVEGAKSAIEASYPTDPEYEQSIRDGAHEYKMLREQNRHKEEMRKAGMGVIGNILGDGQQAPFSIALIAILLGIAFSVVIYVTTPVTARGDVTELTLSGVTLATGALGYVFGRKTS